jgi:hypothetical protein
MDPLHVFFDLTEILDGLDAHDRDRLRRIPDFGTLESVAAFVAEHAGEATDSQAMAERYVNDALQHEHA